MTGTLGHALVSDGLAYFYALNPKVARVTLDSGCRRLMEWAQEMMFKKSGSRPDVGILFKEGSMKAIEVVSKRTKRQGSWIETY
ncbi:hypothetical protein ACO0K2_17310 [Undibacterium sp. MH2W]|uniref:hypothetical protein n=1 Tax=Undibacterium sp. MH2W TaxID=3413044 RepID=UPI003BF3F2F8